jgi:hypothetical protein
MSGIRIDITARKLVEEALRWSREMTVLRYDDRWWRLNTAAV